MTVRIIGAGCKHGAACNPGKPARPVYQDGKCYWCWASGKVADSITAQHLACEVCGGDPRGGEVVPVFGGGQEDHAATGHASLPEPILFCLPCANALRARRNASAVTAPIDTLEVLGRLPTREHPEPDWPAAA